MGGSRDKRLKEQLDPLEPFSSKEELQEAIDNLRRYLGKLKHWSEIEKVKRPGPSPN